MLTTPDGRKVGQLRTKSEQTMYTKIDTKFETAKSSVLHGFVELTKYNVDEEQIGCSQYQH